MKKFLNPSYWFALWPGPPDLRFWRVIIVVAVVAITLAIAASVLARRYRSDGLRRRTFSRLMAWGYTVGPVFLILAFFRYQSAYFLGMRVWYLSWGIVSFVWAVFILKYQIIDLPKKLKLRQGREEFAQYLPKKQS